MSPSRYLLVEAVTESFASKTVKESRWKVIKVEKLQRVLPPVPKARDLEGRLGAIASALATSGSSAIYPVQSASRSPVSSSSFLRLSHTLHLPSRPLFSNHPPQHSPILACMPRSTCTHHADGAHPLHHFPIWRSTFCRPCCSPNFSPALCRAGEASLSRPQVTPASQYTLPRNHHRRRWSPPALLPVGPVGQRIVLPISRPLLPAKLALPCPASPRDFHQ